MGTSKNCLLARCRRCAQIFIVFRHIGPGPVIRAAPDIAVDISGNDQAHGAQDRVDVFLVRGDDRSIMAGAGIIFPKRC